MSKRRVNIYLVDVLFWIGFATYALAHLFHGNVRTAMLIAAIVLELPYFINLGWRIYKLRQLKKRMQTEAIVLDVLGRIFDPNYERKQNINSVKRLFKK